MQGKKHYAEQLFTAFRLSEHVPDNNFYRRLSQAIDLHWLYGATKGYYGTEGQQSIDPVVFFKLILIGYLENLASDRRIIATASLRLDLLLFIGYSLEEPLPWHSTPSRTRQRYGEELFKELFRRVLTQCVERGMVSGRRQAIDSVPVKANASMDSLQLKEIIADADAYAGELAENEEDKPGVSAARQKRVAQHHSYKAKAYKDMPSGNRSRAKFVSNHTHCSPTDPDARISVKPGKPRQLNYHAQVAVNTARHVITHIEAGPADKKDSQSLPAVLAHTLENLKANGLEAEAILADGGYSSGEALQALEDRGLGGYIPNFGQYKSERQGFSYDKAHDRYTCSRGVHLPYKKTLTSTLGYTRKVYRSSARDCKGLEHSDSAAIASPQVEKRPGRPLFFGNTGLGCHTAAPAIKSHFSRSARPDCSFTQLNSTGSVVVPQLPLLAAHPWSCNNAVCQFSHFGVFDIGMLTCHYG